MSKPNASVKMPKAAQTVEINVEGNGIIKKATISMYRRVVWIKVCKHVLLINRTFLLERRTAL